MRQVEVRRSFFIAILLGTACVAQANSGTPLIWGSAFFLLLGNLLIALLETALLRKLHKAEIKLVPWQLLHPESSDSLLRNSGRGGGYAVLLAPWIVVGNYVSAFAGAHLLTKSEPLQELILGPRPVEKVPIYVATLWILAFLLSLILELPFFSLATRLRMFSRQNLGMLLKVHLVSYAVITCWFLWLSDTSFLFSPKVVAAMRIKGATPAWVYYIDESDRVRRVSIDGSSDEPVAARIALPPGLLDYTFLSAEPGKDGRARLVAASELHVEDPVTVIEDLGINAQVTEPTKGSDGKYRHETFGYWTGRTFRPEEPRFRTGSWAYEGVSITGGSRSFKLALETPFLSWNCRSAYTLPSGHGVVQFGPQIVLIDADSGRVAFLARGRGSTVLLEPLSKNLPKQVLSVDALNLRR